MALLPEPDGSSRLWVVQDPEGGPAGPTVLRFRDPTGIEVTADAVWVGDADGLHRVDLAMQQPVSTTVWSTPIRSLHDGFALDDAGYVIGPGDGQPAVIQEDPAATEFAVVAGQLVLLHQHEGEAVVVDPDSFS
jgi:hypothetical protein